MDKSAHEPTGFGHPDACLAKVVEHAQLGDRTALASLLEQAQRGVDEASAFFIGQLQQEHSPVERLQQEHSITRAFLVEYAQQGNEIAFNFLYEHYLIAILRYLTRMVGGDEWIGWELTQDTFTSAWRSLPTTDEGLRERFRPWLYQIATNKSRDHFRKRENRIATESLEACDEANSVKGASEEEPENMVGHSACVEQALSRVSPLFRTCIDKKDQGYTLREIADELGVTPQRVTEYLARGRKQFRQAYRRLISEQLF
jgi:RNA polymerase sigma factor (sigma-70 family)